MVHTGDVKWERWRGGEVFFLVSTRCRSVLTQLSVVTSERLVVLDNTTVSLSDISQSSGKPFTLIKEVVI